MYYKWLKAEGSDRVAVTVFLLGDFKPQDTAKWSDINVILDPAPDWDMVDLLFGPFQKDDVIILAPRNTNWPAILHSLGCFSSRSQAARAWLGAKRKLEVTEGVGTYSIGLGQKMKIVTWKPRCEKKNQESSTEDS